MVQVSEFFGARKNFLIFLKKKRFKKKEVSNLFFLNWFLSKKFFSSYYFLKRAQEKILFWKIDLPIFVKCKNRKIDMFAHFDNSLDCFEFKFEFSVENNADSNSQMLNLMQIDDFQDLAFSALNDRILHKNDGFQTNSLCWRTMLKTFHSGTAAPPGLSAVPPAVFNIVRLY